MIIAVGSTNPTKIQPVATVFTKHFPDAEVVPADVSSGVSDQPMDDAETFRGANNRALASLEKIPLALYGVGIEGGIHKHPYGWVESSIVVIADRKGNIGIGKSGGLVLPRVVIEKIESGKNLEEAIDELFGTSKIGRGIGMFGIMTKNVVTRSSGVEHAVAFALARFLHEDIYET